MFPDTPCLLQQSYKKFNFTIFPSIFFLCTTKRTTKPFTAPPTRSPPDFVCDFMKTQRWCCKWPQLTDNTNIKINCSDDNKNCQFVSSNKCNRNITYLRSHGMLLFVLVTSITACYLHAARSACCKWNASKTPLSKYEIYGFMMTIGAVPENTKWIAAIAAAAPPLLAHVARMQQAISALGGFIAILFYYFAGRLIVRFLVCSLCKKLAKTLAFSITAMLLRTVAFK